MSKTEYQQACEQAYRVLQSIRDLANDDQPVRLSRDWGGDTLTVAVGRCHVHVGTPMAEHDDFASLVGELHRVLVESGLHAIVDHDGTWLGDVLLPQGQDPPTPEEFRRQPPDPDPG